MIKVKLVEIKEADFRLSEASNFAKIPKGRRESLKFGEAICFISRTGNQIVFVHRSDDMGKTARGKERRVVYSTRLRLTRGSWSPDMLANYADDVGLQLIGLKRFETLHAKLRR